MGDTMQNYKIDAKQEATADLSSKILNRRSKETNISSLISPQHDTVTQVSCRIGDTSCANAHASSLKRKPSSRSNSNIRSIINLQQNYGNRFVQRVIALQRAGSGKMAVDPDIEQTIQQARGSGQPLDSHVQGQMESAFNAEFSSVRIHNDSRADQLNRALNAHAFTTGTDIFFRQGAHNPGSSSGRELLAHELTHVVQQNGDEVRPKLTLGEPGDRYEQEADQTARAVIQQEQNGCCVHRQFAEEEEEMQAKLNDPHVQRQEEEEEDMQASLHDKASSFKAYG